MQQKKYRVTCLKCGESDILTIETANHLILDFAKQMLTNILAGRWRKDLQWGFECRCGNDNRLAAAEKDEFDALVQGSVMTVEKIARSLQIPDEKQFKMVEV
ncbi:MAG: hypothetical protein EPO02_13565 [Nitrospirae bacterium]|nr:MAG: hypothetical protein EPO02_13565 [Nitrospirota bacterium]